MCDNTENMNEKKKIKNHRVSQLTNILGKEVKTQGLLDTSSRLHPRSVWPFRVNEVFRGSQAAVERSVCVISLWIGGGVGRTLVVRVCVVAPPVALCGTSRGRLVADRVTGDRRPPIRGVCVMSLLPVMGVGGLSLGLCTPPWMAVMGSGSTLTMVWWIMMMVVLSLPEE